MEDKKKVKTTIEKSHQTNTLKCQFTEVELKELSQTMAQTVKNLTQRQAEKKKFVKELDGDIARDENEVQKLSVKITDGYEMRAVKCTMIKDFKTGFITVTRDDTSEVIKTREMDEDERQMKL